MYIIKERETTITSFSQNQPWRFQKKDGTWTSQIPQLISKKESLVNDFQITVFHYETCDGQIKGTRTCIEAGDHTCFIADQLTTEEAYCIHTDFCLDNTSGNSWCNIPDKHRLVARASDKAMKHFYLQAEIDAQDRFPDTGLLMPYKIDENKHIHYSLYEGLHTFGHDHLNIFGICHADDANIKSWHFIAENGVHFVNPKDHSEGWCLELQEDTVKVYSQLDPCNVVRVKFE